MSEQMGIKEGETRGYAPCSDRPRIIGATWGLGGSMGDADGVGVGLRVRSRSSRPQQVDRGRETIVRRVLRSRNARASRGRGMNGWIE